MSSLGCGVVGCGWAAEETARAVDAHAATSLVATYDRDPGRATELARAYPGAVAHTSLDALLADERVVLVYVALPHHLLADVADRSLRAGKHVLVEKPAALSVDEIRSVQQLAADRGLALGVMFELRAAGAVREARRLVAEQTLGEVRAVRIATLIDKPMTYWQSRWRATRAEAGGGVVLMNSIHQIDLVRYVTGLEFVRGSAEIATLFADVEVEDAAAAALRLSNGGIASLVAAAHSPGAADEERVELEGAAGRLEVGAASLRLYLRSNGCWVDLAVPATDLHAELWDAFVTAVTTGARPLATADDAAAALAVVLALYRSSV